MDGFYRNFAGDFYLAYQKCNHWNHENWSKIALEWNLANDAQFQPFTPGGCTQCKGAITINSAESYNKNVAYYIIAHVLNLYLKIHRMVLHK